MGHSLNLLQDLQIYCCLIPISFSNSSSILLFKKSRTVAYCMNLSITSLPATILKY